jgi:hypothetical protein
VRCRHSLFETDVTEHRPLNVLAASHRLRAGCSRIAQILAPHRGAGGFFNGLLGLGRTE